jgi:hypothetical protein
MEKLNDYSGPYKPDLRLEDLSKGFLIKLIEEYQYAWLRLSGAWYDHVKDKFGAQAANEAELVAWCRMAELINPRYARLANIQLNTVLDSLKVAQLPLDNKRVDGLSPPGEDDIKNPNHVIMTVRKCRVLEFFERSAPERIEPMCHVLEQEAMYRYFINPYIKITPLKLPPRKSPDEIACQWELIMSNEKQWEPGQWSKWLAEKRRQTK